MSPLTIFDCEIGSSMPNNVLDELGTSGGSEKRKMFEK